MMLLLMGLSVGVSSVVQAQKVVTTNGGSKKNNKGAISYTVGQPADAILQPNRVANEGVQQPYREDSLVYDAEVCQFQQFIDEHFRILASATEEVGVFFFRDTLLNVNRFGGDSIIVLRLTVNEIPELEFGSKTDVLCFGESTGSLTVSATHGTSPYSYSIDRGASSQASPTFGGLAAGIYSVWVTDDKGCIDSTTVVIDQPMAPLAFAISDNQAICNGGSAVLAATEVTGGTVNSGYSYSWTADNDNAGLPTNVSIQSITVEPTQTTVYTLRVTDDNGCHLEKTTTVTVNPLPLLSAETDSVSCNGLSDGSITVTASGATEPYTYILSTGVQNNTGIFTGLIAATYSVTVRDSNNCEQILADIVVSEPAVLTLSYEKTDSVHCNGASDGEVTLTATGGNGDYQYKNGEGEWQGSNVFSGLAAGDYTFKVRDARGCEQEVSMTMNEPAALTLSYEKTDSVHCNGGANGVVTLT
ncbi:MAG: SprB repeat-containing protein, partial [Bacteroidales bacterium]|nr:SprB repeat-containing protein [Bacteroidales bacterium]